MSINSYQEQVFYHYILSNAMFLNTSKPEFFTNQNIREIFEIAKEYALQYKEPPSKEQMIQLIQMKGLSEKFNNDMVDGLYNSKQLLSQYGNEWLDNNVGPWIQVRNLDNVMRKAIAYMKTTKVTAENAAEVVEKVRHMLSNETVIDFSFDLGKNFFDPASHLQTRLARTSTGYDYIDICTKGGYWKGSLMVLFGMPKSGKSMWLCNMAAKSVMQGHNTAYITLELQEELVNMRIGANMLNVPLDEYDEFCKDQPLLKQKLTNLRARSLKPLGELHVKEFPSSTASANDVSAYLLKAQEILGYKFDNIFIDYINIMKNWRNANSENTYIKIKQISEDIRAMGQENNWAIISVTQTNRSGWEANDLGLGSIAESAGLLHTVDILFGIVTNAEMKARGEYFLKCLANRVAGYENTRKRFTIDWKYARIEEDRNSPIQDMEFFINQISAGHKNPRGQFAKSSSIDIHEAINKNASILQQPIIEEKELNNEFTNITGSNLF
jgi:KaiC/GvpD/RAD55 family RecA-like ATPase